ncbi:MAG: SRPBCC domain-containing protein [Proteobacteria bacterium]|nr:SRPBCC domain-containing protein [Pseudomonadota bacterium]
MTETRPEARSVTIEREFAHPPAKLWRALTQPRLVADWLMQNDFALAVGHKFNLSGDWGGTLDCEVLEIEPEASLAYTWNHVHDDPQFDLRSTVTFTLTPTLAGTLLRVEQAGFRPEQSRAFGGATWGWRQNFDKLDALLGGME